MHGCRSCHGEGGPAKVRDLLRGTSRVQGLAGGVEGIQKWLAHYPAATCPGRRRLGGKPSDERHRDAGATEDRRADTSFATLGRCRVSNGPTAR